MKVQKWARAWLRTHGIFPCEWSWFHGFTFFFTWALGLFLTCEHSGVTLWLGPSFSGGSDTSSRQKTTTSNQFDHLESTNRVLVPRKTSIRRILMMELRAAATKLPFQDIQKAASKYTMVCFPVIFVRNFPDCLSDDCSETQNSDEIHL